MHRPTPLRAPSALLLALLVGLLVGLATACGGSGGGGVVEPDPNEAPTATVTAPAGGSTFDLGTQVTFMGTGTDPEDGTLPGTALSWSSNLDGALGTGATLSTTTLTEGAHTVTLQVEDSEGLTDTDTVTVTIEVPAIPTPGPGELVITEIMVDPDVVDDADGEWFEVFSAATDVRDLQGVTLSDGAGNTVVIGEQLLVNPGSYTVLGPNDDASTNGDVPVAYAYGAWLLSQSGGTVRLLVGATVIDEVTYTAAWPFATGASMSLNPPTTSAAANDTITNWCQSISPYGPGDNAGTPGQPNDGCP